MRLALNVFVAAAFVLLLLLVQQQTTNAAFNVVGPFLSPWWSWWNKMHDGHEQQQHIGMSIAASPARAKRVPIEVYSSCAMTLDVAIGTPARIYKLSLNFIDDHTILLANPVEYESYSKADPPVYDRRLYNSSDSSTFLDLKINYTNPVIGVGLMVSDVFNFPNARPLAIPNGTRFGFVLLTEMTGLYSVSIRAMPVDGELGFGPLKKSSREGTASFLGIIAEHMPVPPVLTFHFHKFNAVDPDEQKQHSQAVLSFDATDRLQECCNASSWVQMPINQTQDAWLLQMDSMSVGETHLSAERLVVIVDPGWGYHIYLPEQLLTKIATLVGAVQSVFREYYDIPCNQTGILPDIKMEISSPVLNGSSTASKFEAVFKSSDYIVESIFSLDPEICQLIFARGYPKWVVLGYAFFNTHCLSLDLGSSVNDDEEKAVGFAYAQK